MTEKQEMLSATQAADLLGVSRVTVYRLAERRELPAVYLTRRLLRFRREDLKRFIEERTTTGGDA